MYSVYVSQSIQFCSIKVDYQAINCYPRNFKIQSYNVIFVKTFVHLIHMNNVKWKFENLCHFELIANLKMLKSWCYKSCEHASTAFLLLISHCTQSLTTTLTDLFLWVKKSKLTSIVTKIFILELCVCVTVNGSTYRICRNVHYFFAKNSLYFRY